MARVRLDECPELEDVWEHLEQLSVRDIRISDYELDGQKRWMGIIILRQTRGELVWVLSERETRDAMKGAIEMLLRGLVDGRLEAMDKFPGSKLANRDAAMGLVTAMHRASLEDQFSPPEAKKRSRAKKAPPA